MGVVIWEYLSRVLLYHRSRLVIADIEGVHKSNLAILGRVMSYS